MSRSAFSIASQTVRAAGFIEAAIGVWSIAGPELIEYPDATVLICEGEKDANNLRLRPVALEPMFNRAASS